MMVLQYGNESYQVRLLQYGLKRAGMEPGGDGIVGFLYTGLILRVPVRMGDGPEYRPLSHAVRHIQLRRNLPSGRAANAMLHR